MKEKKEEVIKPPHNNIEIAARILQSVCLGLFALGIASGFGDYNTVMNLPFSKFSIITFIFGLFGTIITEIIARKSKKW